MKYLNQFLTESQLKKEVSIVENKSLDYLHNYLTKNFSTEQRHQLFFESDYLIEKLKIEEAFFAYVDKFLKGKRNLNDVLETHRYYQLKGWDFFRKALKNYQKTRAIFGYSTYRRMVDGLLHADREEAFYNGLTEEEKAVIDSLIDYLDSGHTDILDIPEQSN